MRVLRDIRLFTSQVPNKDGEPLPTAIGNKSLNVQVHRIVMKLRENGFSCGDFDHLYLNFTTCPVEDGIAPSRRSVDKYHSWYRYYDVEVPQRVWEQANSVQAEEQLLVLAEKVLTQFFAKPEFDAEKIHQCVREAITQKETMLMKFKEKRSAKGSAEIYLRYLDSGKYRPLLRVTDTSGELQLEADLPDMLTLDALGEIVLTTKRVTIRPRRNAYTGTRKPISFSL